MEIEFEGTLVIIRFDGQVCLLQKGHLISLRAINYPLHGKLIISGACSGPDGAPYEFLILLGKVLRNRSQLFFLLSSAHQIDDELG